MTEPGERVEPCPPIHIDGELVHFSLTHREVETLHRALTKHAWDCSDDFGRNDLRTITARALAANVGATRALRAVRR